MPKHATSTAARRNTVVNLVYGLLALAVVIAVFGIANALNQWVRELAHEFGLLRAVGASRRQIRAIVRMESEITALLGAVQGIVTGVLLVVFALRARGRADSPYRLQTAQARSRDVVIGRFPQNP